MNRSYNCEENFGLLFCGIFTKFSVSVSLIVHAFRQTETPLTSHFTPMKNTVVPPTEVLSLVCLY